MSSEMPTDAAYPAYPDAGSPRYIKKVDDMSSKGSSATSPVLPSSPDGGNAGTPKTAGLIGRVQARVRPDETYREEIVRSIFGEVGMPVEDFSCAVESRILLHGRMYVTDTYVCFYSNLFGFEKTIKIPFCHMRCITKEKTALFIPNAIAIITAKKEYIFRSFWDREDAFRTLKACHQESALPRGISSNLVSEHQEGVESRRMARRRSSNSVRRIDSGTDDRALRSNQKRSRIPWPGRGVSERRRPLSSVSGDGDGGDNKHDASTTSSTGSAEAQAVKQRDAQRLDDDATQQSAVTGLEMDVEAEEHGVDPIQRERDEHDVDMESIDVDSYVEEDERESRSEEGCDSEVDELGVEGTPAHAASLGEPNGGGGQSSKLQEFELALDALGEGKPVVRGGRRDQPDSGNSGATRRITTEFPCQLQIFFDMFFANDAEKGLPGFHESQGDSEVKVTPWKVAGGGLGMTREIRFVHPISAPMGPNQTRTVKLQRCRLYDEHGIIIETSTHLEDIMMSDHFQIEDRCIVQPTGDDTIRVDVQVEIKFLKSTMFRKTIETKSLHESREVWEAFFSMAKEAIQSMQPALPQRRPSGVNDSDDEARMRATRERLRERRKRHRSRNQSPHHPARDHSTESFSSVTAAKAHTSRPRAKSASSRIPADLLVEGKLDRSPAKKVQVGVRSAGSALQASVSSAGTVSFWFAAVPWILLAIVFLVEGVQLLYFSREAGGFLEAAEAALTVVVAHEEEGNVRETLLREELARGLLKIYSRNRFFWPFNTLL